MRRICATLLYITMFCVPCVHGAEHLGFEHIGLEQGLSHNSVTSVAQDTMGIVWLGTRNGLNRYDGAHITTYYSRRGDTNALPENQIKRIKSLGSKLYIQTFGAISVFDVITERFTNFSMADIRSFDVDRDNLWIVSTSGLYVLRNGAASIVRVEAALPSNELLGSVQILSRELMIGTNKGLYSYNYIDPARKILDGVSVVNLFVDSHRNLWVCTMTDGLYRIDNANKVVNYREPAISNNFVRCIEQDDKGNIWFGTLTGLDLLDTHTGTSQSYGYDERDPTQMSHSSVWTLFKDRSGALWAGTYFGGVNIFHPTTNTFRYYPVSKSDRTRLNFRIIGSMVQDHKGNLFIGTEGAGLDYYDRANGEFRYYPHNPSDPNSISCNNVKCIYNDKDSVLWIGTHTGGLNKFDIASGRFTHLQSRESHRKILTNCNISDIKPFGDKYLLASHNGVIEFNPRTLDVQRFLPDKFHKLVPRNVVNLTTDKDNNLWIATEFHGLGRYDIEKGTFNQYMYNASDAGSVSSNLINSIYQDRFGRIWVCTPSGLDLYRPASNDFEHFTMADGLPSDIVLNVIDSRYEDILVTTNRGISILNYTKRQIINYTRENGLPLSEVNQNGLFSALNGEVFLGGFNGMVSFSERELMPRTPDNKIEITGLRVRQRLISPSDTTGILRRSIMLTDKIVLSSKNNTFTLLFSDMGMTLGQKTKLMYKLHGYDKEFVTADATNQASYTNVPAGKYDFVVRYAMYEGGEQSEARLIVVVKAPFYWSWWAIIIYTGITTAILYLLNSAHLRRRRAEYKLAIQQVEYDRQNEYNQSKLRFFTNLSHEFRTPLTLISGQLEHLLENRFIPPLLYKRILGAFNNTKRLQSMIDELLDFRKQTEGYSSIEPATGEFNELVREVFVSYVELASHRKIHYTLDIGKNPVFVDFDAKVMDKALYNLISNAFKFTKPKGSIAVSVIEQEHTVQVAIIDNGVGIPEKSLDKIFDSFYQAENSYGESSRGTGLGLAMVRHIIEAHSGTISVTSTIGQGSTFTISLPKSESVQTTEPTEKSYIQSTILNDPAQAQEIVSSISAREPKHRPKILIVEDNGNMREFLREILSPLYIISEASDGQQGFEMAKKIQPAIVLSDVMMPNMSGTEMCIKLKSDFATSHIPVVLITARTATEHKVEGLGVGADDYITKPFSIKLLIARIENVLGNRRLLQERFAKEPASELTPLTTDDIDAAFMLKAHAIIEKNIDNADYSVVHLASDMCLGRTTLFQKIKGITGGTPNEFILTIRLRYAVRLMSANADISISEVADRCGFASPQYFSTCFKRHFNASPSNYFQRKEDTAQA